MIQCQRLRSRNELKMNEPDKFENLFGKPHHFLVRLQGTRLNWVEHFISFLFIIYLWTHLIYMLKVFCYIWIIYRASKRKTSKYFAENKQNLQKAFPKWQRHSSWWKSSLTRWWIAKSLSICTQTCLMKTWKSFWLFIPTTDRRFSLSVSEQTALIRLSYQRPSKLSFLIDGAISCFKY